MISPMCPSPASCSVAPSTLAFTVGLLAGVLGCRDSQKAPSPDAPDVGRPSSSQSTPIDAGAAGPSCRIVGKLSSARHNLTIVALPDGRVLFVGGGITDVAGPQRQVDVYDPGTGEVSLLASMHTGRISPGVAVLPDGRLVVAGDSPSIDVYEPKLGLFREVQGVMPRYQDAAPLAIPLSGGRVLLGGGTVGGRGSISYFSAVFDVNSGKVLEAQDTPWGMGSLERLPVRPVDGGVIISSRPWASDARRFPVWNRVCEVFFDENALKWKDLKSCHLVDGGSNSDVATYEAALPGGSFFDGIVINEHTTIVTEAETGSVLLCTF
jgi:hypothetical protein